MLGVSRDHSSQLTTAEAADYLGFGKSTLEKWRTTGEGPEFEKVGQKIVRYTPAKLDEFRYARRFKSTSEYSPPRKQSTPRQAAAPAPATIEKARSAAARKKRGSRKAS